MATKRSHDDLAVRSAVLRRATAVAIDQSHLHACAIVLTGIRRAEAIMQANAIGGFIADDLAVIADVTLVTDTDPLQRKQPTAVTMSIRDQRYFGRSRVGNEAASTIFAWISQAENKLRAIAHGDGKHPLIVRLLART